MEKLNDIVEMIDTYTNQIERYENLSTWYAAFSTVCIVLILWYAVHLILCRGREGEQRQSLYNVILSGVFMLIPAIVTLYLYVFAMNMRKVALYRGYLCFLEEQWNALSGLEIMQFDRGVIKEFFSFQSFLTNGLGPVVMALFIVFAFGIGFGLSIFYLMKLKRSAVKSVLTGVLCVLVLVCISFSGLCTYYLSINDSVVEAVVEYCQENN